MKHIRKEKKIFKKNPLLMWRGDPESRNGYCFGTFPEFSCFSNFLIRLPKIISCANVAEKPIMQPATINKIPICIFDILSPPYLLL